MADQDQKGAISGSNTVMINTTDAGATPKKTPMLKLGRKKIGATRGSVGLGAAAEEESKGSAQLGRDQPIICPFRECGRKFVSDLELKGHMTRRHKPTVQPDVENSIEESKHVVETDTSATTQETPVPAKNKIKFIQGSSAASIDMDFKETVPQQHTFSGAKPKVLARPATAAAKQGKMGPEQANILRAMMQAHHQPKKGGDGGFAQRPRTAATSTAYDERRIKDKLRYLEDVFNKIDDQVMKTADDIDIDFFRGKQNPALADLDKPKTGVKLTKALVVENSMLCDELDEITTLMLRDKQISIFDDNIEDVDAQGERFKLEQLCNLECLMASHNLIKDISGITQLTTLVELNLSYNMLTDIAGIEVLTQLRVLYLNHNKIAMIDQVAKLLNLRQLGIFYNDVIDGEHAMSILMKCTKLKEVSVAGNPCARKPEFGYELLMRLPSLQVFNEEAVKELDRDIAEQYYEMYELEKPQPYKPESQVALESKLKSKTVLGADGKKKCVRFSEVDADDVEECGHEKDLKALHEQIMYLDQEKYTLQKKLTQSNFDAVYQENERLQQQLKNMQSLREENQNMRDELEILQASTFDDRTAEVASDNKRLKTRNAELQIELLDTKAELRKLKKSVAHLPNDASAQQQALLMGGSTLPARPQTAAVRSNTLADQWMADPTFSLDEANDDIDRELAEMMQRNQARLAEMKNDIKQVSKLADEPYINVRKVRQPTDIAKKQRRNILEGAVDENVDAI